MNAFLQTLRNLGPMRLAAIAVVALSLLGMLGFITTRISTSPLALLYTELDQHDSAAIAEKLDTMKIPYQVDASGSLIRVPSDQVGKLRMMMAADGLPKGGSVGYEIFDQKEGFGTTSFVQNINHLRALEGELARTIGAMDPIQNARVHLVLPQRELFSHDTQTATASIFLKMRNGAVLSREQIAAIQHLIAASVPQLQPNQVSIVDDRGNLLARPSNSAADGSSGSDDQDDMRMQFEQAQARKIEDLLTQTLGYGKVRAQVSADLDFDKARLKIRAPQRVGVVHHHLLFRLPTIFLQHHNKSPMAVLVPVQLIKTTTMKKPSIMKLTRLCAIRCVKADRYVTSRSPLL